MGLTTRGRVRTVALIAIAAGLIGCDSVTPSPDPSVEPTSAAVASPTAPTPTYRLIQTYPPTPAPPPPTPEPPEQRCPVRGTDDTGFASINDGGSVGIAPRITSLSRIDTGEALPLPSPPPNFGWWPAFLISRSEMRFSVSYYGSGRLPFAQDITITSLTVSLTSDDGQQIDLDARYEPNPSGVGTVAVVALPRISMRGTMMVSTEWRDACFKVAARGSTPIIVDPPSALDGCPETRDAGFESVARLFEDPAAVGPLQVDAVALGQGKLVDLSVIDPLPPYVGFDADTPRMRASPGDTIAVAFPNPDVAIHARIREKVIAFRRAPLMRWIEGGWIHGDEPAAEIVFRSALVDLGDGRFTFTTPTQPGRYAIEAVFDYDAACSYGTTGFVVGVDVE